MYACVRGTFSSCGELTSCEVSQDDHFEKKNTARRDEMLKSDMRDFVLKRLSYTTEREFHLSQVLDLTVT